MRGLYLGYLQTLFLGVFSFCVFLLCVCLLEQAFGDLDDEYQRYGMGRVLKALEYGRADARAGRPLPNGIVTSGDKAVAMASLRHAANRYLGFLRTTEAKL